MKPEIIIAVDNMKHVAIEQLIHRVAGQVWGLKFNDLLLEYGSLIVGDYGDRVKVMLDPKLYDIPNTMANSVRVVGRSGAKLVTVHLSAGLSALKATMEEAAKFPDLQVFGVTILTSMTEEEVKSTYNCTRQHAMTTLMLGAKDAGITGVVCAADQVEMATRLGLKTLVPAVRIPTLDIVNDDQVHKATSIPDSDYIVVGRPITTAINPEIAVQRIKEAIEHATAVTT